MWTVAFDEYIYIFFTSFRSLAVHQQALGFAIDHSLCCILFPLAIFASLPTMSATKDEYSSAEQGGENALTTTRSAGVGSLLEEHDQLERGLKSRHIQFMALGGA